MYWESSGGQPFLQRPWRGLTGDKDIVNLELVIRHLKQRQMVRDVDSPSNDMSLFP